CENHSGNAIDDRYRTVFNTLHYLQWRYVSLLLPVAPEGSECEWIQRSGWFFIMRLTGICFDRSACDKWHVVFRAASHGQFGVSGNSGLPAVYFSRRHYPADSRNLYHANSDARRPIINSLNTIV